MQTAQLLKAKREERAAALDKVKALSEKIQNKTWAEETDGPALDTAQRELETLETEVRRLEGVLDIEARSAGWTSSTTTSTPVTVNVIEKRGDKIEDVRSRFHFADAILVLTGKEKFEGVVKEMHDHGTSEAQDVGLRDFGKGIMIPSFIQERKVAGFHKRDMSTTTTDGGYTIATQTGQLIPYLDPQGVLSRLGVRFLPGLVGNIDFPRNDGTTTAVWAAEQGASTESNPTVDRVQMAPNRLTAWSDFSTQLMRQSNLNVENFVRDRLMKARDNALDLAALTGGGGTTPTGITGTTGVNTVTIAASPTWAKIVDFETQVATDDALNEGAIAYLTTPGVAGILKTIKRDVAGNGFIWEGNNVGGGSINGYRAITSTIVPTASSGHYMFFGDWSRLIAGQWGGSELMLDPYTGLTTATMRIVLNTWHDIAIEQGKAFCYSSTVHPS